MIPLLPFVLLGVGLWVALRGSRSTRGTLRVA